jgi:hypothetical protein
MGRRESGSEEEGSGVEEDRHAPSCSLYRTSSERGARTMDPVVGNMRPPGLRNFSLAMT